MKKLVQWVFLVTTLLPILFFGNWYLRENGILRMPGSRDITQKLLDLSAIKNAPIPLTDVYNEQWDFVCPVPPYESAYKVIGTRKNLALDVTQTSISPWNYSLYESYWGLTFIQKNGRAVFFEIYSPDIAMEIKTGSDCPSRDQAQFIFTDPKHSKAKVLLTKKEE